MLSRIIAHGALLLGVLIVAFPIYMTLVGSTHDAGTIGRGDVPLLPGAHALENYATAWNEGGGRTHTTPASTMLINSLIMAVAIALG